jgi:hypothetical protein
MIGIDAEGRPIYGPHWRRIPKYKWNAHTALYELVDQNYFRAMLAAHQQRGR